MDPLRLLLVSWTLSACGRGRSPKTAGPEESARDSDAPGSEPPGSETPDSEPPGKDTGQASADEDGDGYLSVSAEGDDCDDHDAEVHPDAAETCGDGVDNNCDYLAAICSLGAAPARLTGAVAGDDAGFSVAVAGDVNGDGAWDLVVGGVTADVEARDGGAAWIASGPFEGARSLSTALARVGGAAMNDSAGYAVAGPGDLDGDGYADPVVSAPYALEGTGQVYVLLGPLTGASSTSEADGTWRGEAAADRAGIALSPAGDPDGDGMPDLLVGANTADASAEDAGVSYLVSGASAAAGGGLGEASARLLGEAAGDRAGRVAAAGDVNGDGLGDLLLGAPQSDLVAADAGLAAVVLAPVSGDLVLTDADLRLLGEAEGDRAGVGLAGLGDADGDGRSDIAVGGNASDAAGVDAGAVWLLVGLEAGTTSLAMADACLLGEAAGDNAGWPLAAPGDLDADGMADLLVGAWSQDTAATGAGAVYAVSGQHGGTSSLGDTMGRWLGEEAGDGAGFSVATSTTASDSPPIVIGAYGHADGAGVVYVLDGAY